MSENLVDLIGVELEKPWYAQRSKVLLTHFETHGELKHWQDARLSSRVAGLIYMSFFFTDLILIRDVAYYNIMARIVIGLAFIFGIQSQISKGVRSRTVNRQCAFAIVAAYFSWMLCTSYSSNYMNASYYLTYGIIFIVGQNVFFNFSFRLAMLSSTVMLSAFLVVLFTSFAGSHEYATALCALYGSIYTLTLFVNWKLNKERYSVFLNAVKAEIRQQEAAERGAALLKLSTTDALTGLINRRAIDDILRELWRDWQSWDTMFAVILIDIDYFKKYNDQYGHQRGDECLIAVSDAMRKAVIPMQATLGRFGGEEFILLVKCHNNEQMIRTAQQVRSAVELLRIPHEQRNDQCSIVTVSVGAAFSADVAGSKVERLITEADRALYGAKKAGRNCVRNYDRNYVYESEFDDKVAQLLRTAEQDGLVTLSYQPIRNATSGRIVGAEALMRLTDPTGTSVSPSVFIPIAERQGTIVQLGDWAIRTACKELSVSADLAMITVNVSAVQLNIPTFALSVASVISKMNILPSRLVLEVTESLQIEGQAFVAKNIDELRTLGVKIWLDDFGTGFAGLSCIRDISFDAIKIDRSFLLASALPDRADMLRDIVDLVRNVGCLTLVEGIETQAQQDLSTALRIDLVQGYHLGRPMSVTALSALIAQEASTSSVKATA